MLSRFSHVWLCVTLWTAAHQAPLSMVFSRQEYWSGLPFPSPMHESTPLLKLQTYPWIKSPLHFYGTSGLLPLINLFLSHLLTPTTRTLPPCRQHCSTPPIIKIFLMPLTEPNHPLLCHYFCYYLKWVYDNEMFTTENTLSCSYERLGEEVSDLHSLKAIRG